MDNLPSYLFTQGILGVAVFVEGLVILRLYNKVEKIENEKNAILEAWRVEIKDSNKEQLDVLRGNSQASLYLADKIELGKRRK